jgi:hypothetical protein
VFRLPPIGRVVLQARLGATAWCLAGGLGALLCCGGCDGGPHTLGRAAPLSLAFGVPERLVALDGEENAENPTLTLDQLELFYTTRRADTETGADVWYTSRSSDDAAFSAPQVVAEVSSEHYETSPAISADGLTLWLGSDRPGGLGDLDIWVSRRAARTAAWTAPTPVVGLNTPAKEIPRPLGAHDTAMPLSSDRDTTDGSYRTYLSVRSSPGAAFSSPVLVAELIEPGRAITDAFLSEDGLTLWFTSFVGEAPGDLFAASRPSTVDAFGVPQPLTGLNTDGDDRDPWLSADGSTLYFASDRDGKLDIYCVSVTQVE